MRAAAPAYVGTSFDSAPPGHRFRLYFELFDSRWGVEKNRKKEAVGRVTHLSAEARTQIAALAGRQGQTTPRDAMRKMATSVAPIVTGMGMEHPLENGFAFLDPYGVPYLPGSSVKGVLRRAAEELALFEEDSKGWTIPAVWWLFGFDASSGFFSLHARDLRTGELTEHDSVREERETWHQRYRDSLVRLEEDSQGLDVLRDLAAVLRGRKPEQVDRDEALEWARGLEVDPGTRRRPDEVAKLHLRGSLELWDVIPQPPENGPADLRVDIMNPHYGHYYQGDPPGNIQPPHDAGSPNPIFFLTIPEGWRFGFVCRLRPVAALPPWFTEEVGGGPRWQAMVEAALEHAFDWLGFGAKTSLGYGAMERDRQAEHAAEDDKRRRAAEAEEQRRRQEEEERLAAMSPADRIAETVASADNESVAETVRGLDDLTGDDLAKVAAALKARMEVLGIWKVPPKKKKQYERVQRVKRALGENEG